MAGSTLLMVSKLTFTGLQRLSDYCLARAGVERLGGHPVYVEGGLRPWFVLDLGANRARFLNAISARRPCVCVGVEPNPDLCVRLRAQGHSIIQGAVASFDGELPLQVSTNPEATSVHRSIADLYGISHQVEVPAMTFRTLRRRLGSTSIDFLKVDIEGGELDLFADLSPELWQDVRQIAVEFHDHLLDVPTEQSSARILQRLHGLGFRALVLSTPFDHREVLLYHPRRLSMTFGQRCWMGLLRHGVLNLSRFRFRLAVACKRRGPPRTHP